MWHLLWARCSLALTQTVECRFTLKLVYDMAIAEPFFQHYDIDIIELQMNRNFSNICGWFVDDQLNIYFGEGKSQSILFAPLSKFRKLCKLNIEYDALKIKEYSEVIDLGCILDKSLSRESMALNVVSKINTCLKFLCSKNKLLSPQLKQIFVTWIKACSIWYLNFNKQFKIKLQTVLNKYVYFCLQLDIGDGHWWVEQQSSKR